MAYLTKRELCKIENMLIACVPPQEIAQKLGRGTHEIRSKSFLLQENG